MAPVTSEVACSAPSMNSLGFMSGSVRIPVLHFPEKTMLRKMSKLGLGRYEGKQGYYDHEYH